MRFGDFLASVFAAAIGAAIGVAAVAPFLGMPREPFPYSTAEGLVRVLVATHALSYGTRLAPHDLRIAERPRREVPQDSFTSLDALFGADSPVSVIVQYPIAAGEPIRPAKVARVPNAAAPRSGPAAGLRRVPIRVDFAADAAAPGDRVDVLLTRQGESGETTTRVVKGVLVVESHEVRPVYLTLTVEVTTAQAQKIALAQTLGKLSLKVVRKPADGTDAGPDPVRPNPRVIGRRRGPVEHPLYTCGQPVPLNLDPCGAPDHPTLGPPARHENPVVRRR